MRLNVSINDFKSFASILRIGRATRGVGEIRFQKSTGALQRARERLRVAEGFRIRQSLPELRCGLRHGLGQFVRAMLALGEPGKIGEHERGAFLARNEARMASATTVASLSAVTGVEEESVSNASTGLLRSTRTFNTSPLAGPALLPEARRALCR